MVQVYQEPICRRQYNGILSAALIFRVVLFIASVVLSFLIAYGTGGFWKKIGVDVEQPTVHYSGDGLAILEGSQVGQEQVWTTSPALSALLKGRVASASVQVGEEDYNFDGKPETIRFIARIQSATAVNSVKLLLQFQYSLKSAVRMKMYGLAYITFNSLLPGHGLVTDGQLVLQQLTPLPQYTYHDLYNTPLLNSSAYLDGTALQVDAALQLSSIIAKYQARNFTTVFQNQYPIWQAGNGNDFIIDARVRIPANQLQIYRPATGEMLKWGWVQFVSVFLILWCLASWFEAFIFRHRLFETRMVSDLQPKAHKF
eukprot:jgi/Chrzof1/7855/Cz02g38290.t1